MNGKLTSRRAFLLGLGIAIAAPAIVRAESLMKIAVLRETVQPSTIIVAAGELWEGDIKRGTWEQLPKGRFNYRYDDPAGTHGVWWQSGRNHDFDGMIRTMDALKVTSYRGAALSPHIEQGETKV